MIEQTFAPRGIAVLARLASATALGTAAGVLTLWLQGRLDSNWNVLADSGAVWTVVAVVAAAAFGTGVAVSTVAGTVALVGEVAGYYWCAAPWQGLAITGREQVLWTAAALLVGPPGGLAGYALARGAVTQRVMASLFVAGVAAGEGFYGVARVPQHRSASQIEVVLGVVLGLLALVLSRAPLSRRAAALVIGVVVAGGVLFFYSAPTLVT